MMAQSSDDPKALYEMDLTTRTWKCRIADMNMFEESLVLQMADPHRMKALAIFLSLDSRGADSSLVEFYHDGPCLIGYDVSLALIIVPSALVDAVKMTIESLRRRGDLYHTCVSFIRSFVDQTVLRSLVKDAGGVAFIKDGSILPKIDNSNAAITPFISPASMRVSFELPYQGRIEGMLVKPGVTIITGSGFHGKSTLLKSLISGIYYKPPDHPHEFIVSEPSGVVIRSEEGRRVSNVDISPFIADLPIASNISPARFSTESASGSTSMASSVVEAMEFGSKLFFIDEDYCASNFMLQCSRMRALLKSNSMTPLIYRINSLYHEHGISSIVVIGGSGDWFDVHDCALLMDNYICSDDTDRAKGISKTFATGRVQYNGRGLVHRLPWPAIVKSTKRMLDINLFVLSEYETITCVDHCLMYGNNIKINFDVINRELTSNIILGIGVAMHSIHRRISRTAHELCSIEDIILTFNQLTNEPIHEDEIKDIISYIDIHSFSWPTSSDLLACLNRYFPFDLREL
jgi:hypothetical protein